MKKIGIIGGLGALASHHFMGRFLYHFRQFHHIDDDDDFPEICYHSLSSQSMNEKGQMKDYFPELLIEHAQMMEKQGVEVIAIICNTAHIHHEKIQQSLSIPLINMIDITGRYLREKQVSKIAVLCSDFSERQRLHQHVFERYNIETVYPVEYRSEITQLIDCSLKGKNSHTDEMMLKKIAQTYSHSLLGCTELSLIPSEDLHLPGMIDATEILAQHMAFHCE